MEFVVKVPVFEKLVDYIASGIGSVAGPLLAPWRAAREGRALVARAEAQSHALVIISRAQEEAHRSIADSSRTISAELTMADSIEQRLKFQEEKRQRNIISISEKALMHLSEVDEVPAGDPDHDWTARFFGEAQDVSSEGMQKLWSKVLAGEVQRPGQTSIKTLDILRNMNQGVATLFAHLCSMTTSLIVHPDYIADSRVVSLGGVAANNALENYGLGFQQLNQLNEHGLIIAEYDSWLDYGACISRDSIARYAFTFQSQSWELKPNDHANVVEELKVHGVAMTEAGKELSRVVEKQPVPAYSKKLQEFFESLDMQMVPYGMN